MDSTKIPAQSWFERHPRLNLGGFFVICIIGFDLLLGAFFLPNTLHVPNSYSFKENYSGLIPWGPFRTRIHTNSLGFKDAINRTVNLATSSYRIVFLGDSFTEGVGYPYEETFVGKIDATLKPEGVEILNAGASSFSPKLYFLKTKDLIERVGLRFDELDVFIDISDIQDETFYENLQPYEPAGLARKLHYVLKQHSVLYRYAISNVLTWSWHRLRGDTNFQFSGTNEKFNSAYYETRDQWTYDEAAYATWGKRGIELALANMQQLADLLKANNIKLVIAVYPWQKQLINHDLDSKQVQIWQAFSKENNLVFINLFPKFFATISDVGDAQRYFIPNDVHWNALGHQAAANAWLEFYQQNR